MIRFVFLYFDSPKFLYLFIDLFRFECSCCSFSMLVLILQCLQYFLLELECDLFVQSHGWVEGEGAPIDFFFVDLFYMNIQFLLEHHWSIWISSHFYWFIDVFIEDPIFRCFEHKSFFSLSHFRTKRGRIFGCAYRISWGDILHIGFYILNVPVLLTFCMCQSLMTVYIVSSLWEWVSMYLVWEWDGVYLYSSVL